MLTVIYLGLVWLAVVGIGYMAYCETVGWEE